MPTAVLKHLRELSRLSETVHDETDRLVVVAHDSGAAFPDIGDALGMTKQGARWRYNAVVDEVRARLTK